MMNTMRSVAAYFASLILLLTVQEAFVHAQERTEWQDSISAASVTAQPARVVRSIERLETGVKGLRSVVSPLGEGDLIRWAQALPGVTTGADGSSAIYVRGGNMGNNLITLDGIPVYGYSHILGLTTVIPSDVIATSSLSKGGFEGGLGNFTASHLGITTRDVTADSLRASVSLNSFLAGVSVEAPVGRNMAVLLSGRISPLALEYRAAKGMLPDMLGMDDFSAGVGDAYGKFVWRPRSGRTLSTSAFASGDRYSFSPDGDSEDSMGWNNRIGMLTYSAEGDGRSLRLQASVNAYTTNQRQVKTYRGELNDLSLRSEMVEMTASAMRERSIGRHFSMDYGAKLRLATFRPGQVASVSNESRTVLVSLPLQLRFAIPDRLDIRAAAMVNSFRQRNSFYIYNEPKLDVNAALRLRLSRHLSFEATFDRMNQFYHTLEGLPVGWSIDMLVPSGPRILPETAVQGNAGLVMEADRHSLSVAGFHKAMRDLVYYMQAQTLFSGALSSWEDHVDVGDGLSQGAELMYEYTGRDVYGRVAYTISETTRENFARVNEGRPFNARFNRRHVLNATVQWRGLSATAVYQSGHWENGAPHRYTMHIFGEEWIPEHFFGINDFQMPDVFRVDVGYRFGFSRWGMRHDVSIGVCNLTNHFNPFMLYFDASTETWKEMALLPILPNFSWRVQF